MGESAARVHRMSENWGEIVVVYVPYTVKTLFWVIKLA